MILRAPFTAEQVEALNRYQAEGQFHPFTCANRGDGRHGDGEGLLTATAAGWVCPCCDSRQDWAHDFMAKIEE